MEVWDEHLHPQIQVVVVVVTQQLETLEPQLQEARAAREFR
jgi:hypothetical protein